MGGSSSAPPSPPSPPSPTFREPWRNICWGSNKASLQYVHDYKPESNNITHLRILMYGPIGAGKSSFINSVSTTLRRRITSPALANAAVCGTRSFTKKYETHRIRKSKENPKTYYPFVFNDIMGLEEGDSIGVSPEDIKLALTGNVKEGYKFNPVSPLSKDDPGYNTSPSPDDKVHVLVCVLSANVSEVKESVLKKMVDVREMASELGIPQMAVITNIDAACGEIEKDLMNVYKSKYGKKKLKEFSAAVGIPMNCIFPLKNYSEEIDVSEDVDALILSALKQMIDFGNDFIDKNFNFPEGHTLKPCSVQQSPAVVRRNI